MSDEKFLNKYRIPSTRAPWHGYDGGIYFVTICTAGREHFFGEIVTETPPTIETLRNLMIVETLRATSLQGEPKMQLSVIGQYAHEQFANVSVHYPYAEIPLFVIMPNHIHAIVMVDGKNVPYKRRDVEGNSVCGNAAQDNNIDRTTMIDANCRDAEQFDDCRDVALRRTLKVGQKTFRKMSRYYDLGTKLKAVRLHRSGRGCCTIGRLLGVSASQVQRWLNLYNKGGKKALCSVRKEMDLSAKMECVKMVLEKNLPCEQVFMRYQVGRSTLAKWVRKVRETGDYKALRKDANRKYTTMGRPKKKRLEEMTELERLRYENAYLKAEVDLLKKVKALVEAREQSKRKTGHTSSTN